MLSISKQFATMKDIDLLLARYFSGEASEKEQAELADWIDQDPKNQLYFDQLTALFEQAVTVGDTQEPDLSKGLLAFQQHIRKSKSMSKRIYWYVSAVAACLLISLGIFTWFQITESSNTHLTQAKEHLLSDGTKVTLSENSVLQFDENFGKTNRNVELQGQAFFVIGKQIATKSTFRVHVGETIIEDIGTNFEIMANNPKDSILVTVAEGKVLFYTPTNKGIIIEKEASGVFYPSKKSFLLYAKNTASVSKHFQFTASPLKEVVAQLKQAYGMRIALDAAIENKTITVEFQDQELDWVLEIIAETLDLTLIKKQDHYELH